jgi:ATP synthase protein I
MAFNRPIPESKQPAKDSGGVQTLVQAEKMMQIALLLPSAAFVGWLAGAWLDGKLHQSWIGLTGIVFGGVSGLVYVVRLVMVSGGSASAGSKSESDGSGTAGPS